MSALFVEIRMAVVTMGDFTGRFFEEVGLLYREMVQLPPWVYLGASVLALVLACLIAFGINP